MSREVFDRLRAATPGHEELLAYFDTLGPVAVSDMTGLWRGGAWHTGTRFDGLLEQLNWYGKYFRGPNRVEALLYERPATALGWINYATIWPFRLRERRDLLRHPLGRARLRELQFRGQVSAAILYDRLPIADHLRRVDERTVVGLMDLRGRRDSELFFWLERAS